MCETMGYTTARVERERAEDRERQKWQKQRVISQLLSPVEVSKLLVHRQAVNPQSGPLIPVTVYCFH